MTIDDSIVWYIISYFIYCCICHFLPWFSYVVMEMKIVNRVVLLNITIRLYKQEIWSSNLSHTLIFPSQYQLLDLKKYHSYVYRINGEEKNHKICPWYICMSALIFQKFRHAIPINGWKPSWLTGKLGTNGGWKYL